MRGAHTRCIIWKVILDSELADVDLQVLVLKNSLPGDARAAMRVRERAANAHAEARARRAQSWWWCGCSRHSAWTKVPARKATNLHAPTRRPVARAHGASGVRPQACAQATGSRVVGTEP